MWVSVAVGACGFPISESEYSVESTAESQRLVRLFGGSDPRCADAIQSACTDEIEDCIHTAGCEELTACRWTIGHPGAFALCTAEVADQQATLVAHARLYDCVSSRVVDCGFGRDFACAGQYTPPRPPSKSIALSQTLFLLEQAVPAREVKVEICSPLPGCSEPMATAETDEDGFFRVSVAVQQEPASVAGWRGFRRVSNDTIGSVRLQSNIPIWADQYTETSIMATSTVEELKKWFNLTYREAIFVQVLDCRSMGASDLVLEVDDVSYPIVLYAEANEVASFGGDATSAEAGGAAVIIDLVPERSYSVAVRHKDDGALIADGSVYVEANQMAYLTFQPNYREAP